MRPQPVQLTRKTRVKHHLLKKPRRMILRQLLARVQRRPNSRSKKKRLRRRDCVSKQRMLKLHVCKLLRQVLIRSQCSDRWVAVSLTLTSRENMQELSTMTGFCPSTSVTWRLALAMP